MLILTTFDLDEHVFGALQAGASGFLLKDTPPAELLAGIRIIAAGEALLSPSVTRHLIEEFVRRPDPAGQTSALDALTDAKSKSSSTSPKAGRTPRSPSTSTSPPRP